ncbi:hypothetical protein OG777_24730 [Micromonospora peucetia]|uniref:Uncharacterized protein n=1 Tax=Micromonospora peucetia TaxID=47871 RepID=A0A1C6W4N3_9ACTN|nr:protein BatD [Micromonospora peucetia]MCX4390107.1 hypothetical protein [Micromonospora peucetia]WSA32583.1 hypothetical protein OIE14_00315 [Micromonospora peucetia]SCL73451.1 hypothetical protein GA0070608_5736 [Micromonospora peucetia]
MRWLMILIIVLAVIAAVWLWRRSQKASLDVDGQVRNRQASTEARRRLDEHRNPSDGSPGSGAGGVGGVW